LNFVDASEARVLEAAAALANGNPFLPERIEHEQRCLGDAFVPSAPVWHADAELPRPNLPILRERLEGLLTTLRGRLADGAKATRDELGAYEGLVRHALYMRYEDAWTELIEASERGGKTTGKVPGYRDFARDMEHYCDVPGVSLPVRSPTPHLFAWGFQIRRAFHHTYRRIYGGSMPAARLRAAVWQSIFTHDVPRYSRVLFERMSDIPTLITGPSGTGKELVAQAIGFSRYIAFDAEKCCFAESFRSGFHAVNLSALSPTLIESELFGHARGSFTGAVQDRAGWLEIFGPGGTVFLDEIGELDESIQVKLLRVLQTRTFARIGETDERVFQGKIIAATNRDLAAEMRTGGFRQDFYYRLCADMIQTPSLREQIGSDPAEISSLLDVLARRIAGDEEGPSLAGEVESFVNEHLGSDYPWPGNVRELEQCVRNVLIRGYYEPASLPDAGGDALDQALSQSELDAEALMSRHCTHVYARVGSYEEAARRLGIDRRTVKARIDEELLARLKP
jgi:hypothetical protein